MLILLGFVSNTTGALKIDCTLVRDVTFEEDFARTGGNDPIIWAILNCFIISIVRQLGYRTIPQAVPILTNQVRRIFEILTTGFSPPK